MKIYSSGIQGKHLKHKDQWSQRTNLLKCLSTTEKPKCSGKLKQYKCITQFLYPSPIFLRGPPFIETMLWLCTGCNSVSAFCLGSTNNSSFLFKGILINWYWTPAGNVGLHAYVWGTRELKFRGRRTCTVLYLLSFFTLKKKKKKKEKER